MRAVSSIIAAPASTRSWQDEKRNWSMPLRPTNCLATPTGCRRWCVFIPSGSHDGRRLLPVSPWTMGAMEATWIEGGLSAWLQSDDGPLASLRLVHDWYPRGSREPRRAWVVQWVP